MEYLQKCSTHMYECWCNSVKAKSSEFGGRLFAELLMMA